ncbi:unnamed protein product [Amoebophrya sp. A120]|nr:unnamed protein product [Amoebophrya sp. A120]|eukprot:GSA120T00010629001.1
MPVCAQVELLEGDDRKKNWVYFRPALVKTKAHGHLSSEDEARNRKARGTWIIFFSGDISDFAGTARKQKSPFGEEYSVDMMMWLLSARFADHANIFVVRAETVNSEFSAVYRNFLRIQQGSHTGEPLRLSSENLIHIYTQEQVDGLSMRHLPSHHHHRGSDLMAPPRASESAGGATRMSLVEDNYRTTTASGMKESIAAVAPPPAPKRILFAPRTTAGIAKALVQEDARHHLVAPNSNPKFHGPDADRIHSKLQHHHLSAHANTKAGHSAATGLTLTVPESHAGGKMHAGAAGLKLELHHVKKTTSPLKEHHAGEHFHHGTSSPTTLTAHNLKALDKNFHHALHDRTSSKENYKHHAGPRIGGAPPPGSHRNSTGSDMSKGSRSSRISVQSAPRSPRNACVVDAVGHLTKLLEDLIFHHYTPNSALNADPLIVEDIVLLGFSKGHLVLNSLLVNATVLLHGVTAPTENTSPPMQQPGPYQAFWSRVREVHWLDPGKNAAVETFPPKVLLLHHREQMQQVSEAVAFECQAGSCRFCFHGTPRQLHDPEEPTMRGQFDQVSVDCEALSLPFLQQFYFNEYNSPELFEPENGNIALLIHFKILEQFGSPFLFLQQEQSLSTSGAGAQPPAERTSRRRSSNRMSVVEDETFARRMSIDSEDDGGAGRNSTTGDQPFTPETYKKMFGKHLVVWPIKK